MNKRISNLVISPTATVMDAIARISQTGKKVVFVVDEADKLLGIFSDGDLRRHFLSGGKTEDPVSSAMNREPFTLRSDARKSWNDAIRTAAQASYPVVDENGTLADALFWDEVKSDISFANLPQLPASVQTVIMAGGKGTRLYPYTKVLPKPLIPIGDEPICTRVINSFKKYGCSDFHLIVNHQKELVSAFYAAEDTGVSVTCHAEPEPLGTAGGLRLLKDVLHGDFFVSNCDILLRQSYAAVYDFHLTQKNDVTVIGAAKDIQMPYGVIHTEPKSAIVTHIDEKPRMSLLTNVGVYVMNASVLDLIGEDEKLLMTDLIRRCIDQGRRVGVFSIPGSNWLDMGQMEEMKHMVATLERQLT